jgi:hypothetical protein
MSSALEQAAKLIPAEVRMISGCKDEQTSADVSNVARYVLYTYVYKQATRSLHIPLGYFCSPPYYLSYLSLLEYLLIFLLSMQLSAPRSCRTCRRCMVSYF